MEHWQNDTDSGKVKYLEGNLSHATLSTTNPTQINMRLNVELCSDRLVTNHVSHGITSDMYRFYSTTAADKCSGTADICLKDYTQPADWWH